MIKISKRSQYGLRAMVFLARRSGAPSGSEGGLVRSNPISARTISKQEGIPLEFLEKIIHQLVDARLVSVEKGAKGGYSLLKSPAKISAGDVVFVLENLPAGKKKPVVDCSCCGRKNKCATKNVWEKVEKSLYNTLQKITLKQLIK